MNELAHDDTSRQVEPHHQLCLTGQVIAHCVVLALGGPLGTRAEAMHVALERRPRYPPRAVEQRVDLHVGDVQRLGDQPGKGRLARPRRASDQHSADRTGQRLSRTKQRHQKTIAMHPADDPSAPRTGHERSRNAARRQRQIWALAYS